MDDLIERLRAAIRDGKRWHADSHVLIQKRALDEIERLRGELEIAKVDMGVLRKERDEAWAKNRWKTKSDPPEPGVVDDGETWSHRGNNE